MLSDTSRAQHLYNRTHIHLSVPGEPMELHDYIDEGKVYHVYCFYSLCGEWLPTYYFAFGEPDCGCCLAADHLLFGSANEDTMKYRIKATSLIGTISQPAFEHLTQKQAVNLGNELVKQAVDQGWQVDGEFTTAPQMVGINKPGLTRYIAIEEE